jgi:hypothetical protein
MTNPKDGYRGWDDRLADLIRDSEKGSGICVEALLEGDVVSVKTLNSLYMLKIIDPKSGKAIVHGTGDFFSEPTKVSILGSSLSGTGNMIKTRWIIPGKLLILALAEGGTVNLSPVVAIIVNGRPVYPTQKEIKH